MGTTMDRASYYSSVWLVLMVREDTHHGEIMINIVLGVRTRTMVTFSYKKEHRMPLLSCPESSDSGPLNQSPGN